MILLLLLHIHARFIIPAAIAVCLIILSGVFLRKIKQHSDALLHSSVEIIMRKVRECAAQEGAPLPRYDDGSEWELCQNVTFTLLVDDTLRNGFISLDDNESNPHLLAYDIQQNRAFPPEQIKNISKRFTK